MRRPIAVAVLAGTTILALGPGAALSASPTVGVGSGGDRFSPRNVSVPVGGTVTWRWSDGGHNVRIRSGAEGFDSGYRKGGATYSHRFTHAGTYTFVCDAHQPEMRGTVAVGRKAAAAPKRATPKHRRRHPGSEESDD
jgi:plastocyanin